MEVNTRVLMRTAGTKDLANSSSPMVLYMKEILTKENSMGRVLLFIPMEEDMLHIGTVVNLLMANISSMIIWNSMIRVGNIVQSKIVDSIPK